MTSEEIKAAAECIENGSGDMRKQNPNAEFTSYPDIISLDIGLLHQMEMRLFLIQGYVRGFTREMDI